MDTGNVESVDTTGESAGKAARKLAHRFWNEKPATRFCVGFVVFVVAEVIVYVTIHWLIPII